MDRANVTKKKNSNICSNIHLAPDEISDLIFTHYNNQDNNNEIPLKQCIKNLVQLRSTCKKFNRFLSFEYIGNLCTNYSLHKKNNLLQEIINPEQYSIFQNRFPILILICAGADSNFGPCTPHRCLLEKSVLENDVQMVTTLFKHGADPNKEGLLRPIFFYAKNVEMAKIFIDNKVNIHAKGISNIPSVLWHIIDKGYPSELMNFYLTHNVDTTVLNLHECSLLHKIANPFSANPSYVMNTDNFLNQAKLLLNAMPEMVNQLNFKKRTPLDVALKNSEKRKLSVLQTLIKLFKEHGCLTMKELKG